MDFHTLGRKECRKLLKVTQSSAGVTYPMGIPCPLPIELFYPCIQTLPGFIIFVLAGLQPGNSYPLSSLVTCSTLLFVAIRQHDQKQQREERIYDLLQVRDHHQEKAKQDSRSGSWNRNHGGCCLLSVLVTILLLRRPQGKTTL